MLDSCKIGGHQKGGIAYEERKTMVGNSFSSYTFMFKWRSQLGMIVSASELETTEEAQPKEDAVVEQAEETKEDTGKATVEGVTPEEERGESSAQDAETANVPKAAAQEG